MFFPSSSTGIASSRVFSPPKNNPFLPQASTLVATNNEDLEVQTNIKDQFQLAGDPETGTCDLSIDNVQTKDEGEYGFVLFRGNVYYNFWFTGGMNIRYSLKVFVTGKTFFPLLFFLGL